MTTITARTSTLTPRDLARSPRTHGTHPAGLAALAILALGGCGSLDVSEKASAVDQSVLGTAQSFAVLGGSAVTNTGASVVHGDLGVDPGLAVTGFPPGLVTSGSIHAGDAVAVQAQADVTAAYIALAGQTPTVDLTGQDLGGLTLTPGIYHFSSSAQLTGTLTLDAAGDPLATFVFQIGSTLTTASNARVVVLNQGTDCNVFWQVGSSATLGTTTAFKGNLLALTSITLTTGATVSGRVLARNAAVTLDTNDVSILSCDEPAHAVVCGDGLVEGSELCDDGNVLAGDGCDASCTPEHVIVCGDGLVEGSELCDDGNLVSGDGCDASCACESAPAAVCGNGTIDAGETCDDGNVLDGDGCSLSCQVECTGQGV